MSLVSVNSNSAALIPANATPVSLLSAELAVQRQVDQTQTAITAYHEQSLRTTQQMASRITQLETALAAERTAKTASESIQRATVAAKDEQIAALGRIAADRLKQVEVLTNQLNVIIQFKKQIADIVNAPPPPILEVARYFQIKAIVQQYP